MLGSFIAVETYSDGRRWPVHSAPAQGSDPLQPLRTERGVRLAKAWDRLDPNQQAVMLNLIEETAG